MNTILFVVIAIPAILIALLILKGIDHLVFYRWLGKKNKKFRTFADCSGSWLLCSLMLPRKMKRHGMRYWWIGIPLMFISPVALLTYTTVYIAKEDFFPSPLSEAKIPYKTRDDIVAITGLDDFPAFTYKKNVVTPLMFDAKLTDIYYDFDKPLSERYIHKLKNLCSSKDNVFWTNEGDTCISFRRAWDSEYMKSPVKSVSYEPLFDMKITKQGFTIHLSDGATAFELEEFANRKVFNKNTGVSFPPYQLVNFSCQSGLPESHGLYTLLLDKKISTDFIQQIEASPKWEKIDEGMYECQYPTSERYGVCVTIDKNSRVVYCEYGQWIGHCN